MSTPQLRDYPDSLAGAHGRIDAYRDALTVAREALQAAIPYLNQAAIDAASPPNVRMDANGVMLRVQDAAELATAELGVTNP